MSTATITVLTAKQTHRLRIHPVANFLPWIVGPERAEFKRDVAARGILDPAWVWQEPGKDFLWLIDGRNRRAIALELGIDLPVRHWDGEGSLALFIASLNFHRRMLSARQRLQFAAALKRELEAEARRRQAHGQTGPGRTLSANWREASGKAAEQAAQIVGVGVRSVERADAMNKKASNKIRLALKSEQVSVSDVERVINMPVAKQLAALKKVQAKAAKTLAEAAAGDDLAAARTSGVAKLRAARKLFDRLDGKRGRAVVAAIDRAVELATALE